MSIKEKIMNIIALAMSIKATDSRYLTIDWSGKCPNHVIVWVHEHENWNPKRIIEYRTYDGDDGSLHYNSYESMIDWLNRLKREWGKEIIKCQNH